MTNERSDSAVVPMTDERLAEIRQTAADSRAVVARHLTAALNELLVEVDRLNTVLEANRVVRNAAESSCRTYRGAMELVKAERTRLRDELDRQRTDWKRIRDEWVRLQEQLAETSADGAQWQSRAETAERELAELRDEWGTRWEGHERVESYGYGPDAEVLARENTHPRDTLMQRVVGTWKPAEQRPEDGDRG